MVGFIAAPVLVGVSTAKHRHTPAVNRHCVPVATLYGWRHRGEGPPGYRVGRHVRYRRAEVEKWLTTQADVRMVG